MLKGFKYIKWLNCSILPIDGILISTTTPGQSRPGSNSNEEMLYIPQNSWTEASLSDDSVSYPAHLLGEGSYSMEKIQLMYSTAPANKALSIWCLVLMICKVPIWSAVFYNLCESEKN